MVDVSESPRLWFERLYAFLRLPFGAGTVLFGVGVFLALLAIAILWTDAWAWYVSTGFVFAIPLFLIVALYVQYAARRIRHGVERIEGQARTMRDGEALDLGPLYSPRDTFIFIAVATSVIQPLYVLFGLPEFLPIEERVILALPFVYWNLFVNTFVWVWMYSLYTVFKIGRLELAMKPFTEDRSLGLKPLGRFSLELTGLYMLLVALILVPNLVGGLLSLPILGFFLALSLLGLALFFLPLLPLRRTLLETKGELLGRIGPRYTRVFEQIDSGTERRISQSVASELLAIEKIQRDVQRIHTWPFDTGVVVRLSVIVFSVTAIVSARIIASLLGF